MTLSQPITPSEPLASPAPGLSRPSEIPIGLPRRASFARRHRGFLLGVVAPLALVALYLFGIAADQYASEARVVVRGRQAAAAPSGALGELMNAAGFRASAEDGLAVRDYLQSPEAVRTLRGQLDIVAMWRVPEHDLIARLSEAEPSIERLTRYYRRMVSIVHDGASGSTRIEVRAFRPEHAQAITEQLLEQAEELANRLSVRIRDEQLAIAREEVARAEARVLAAREALTAFRQAQQAVDPTREAQISLESVGRLEGTLATTRAELQERAAFMRPDNPQVVVLRNRVDALIRQIAEERARLTQGDAALPQQLAGFERLNLEREFADRQLASALTSLEVARMDVQRQQLFVARIVQPQRPEYALYPERWFLLGSAGTVLLVLYGLGWLLMAGVREHANN
jgi:capsular polysaccharide transport system permease protein